MTKSTYDQIISEVLAERERQDKIWGTNQGHHPVEWARILGMTIGKADKAALDAHYACESFDFLTEYRKELIQTAAVGVAALESPYPGISSMKPPGDFQSVILGQLRTEWHRVVNPLSRERRPGVWLAKIWQLAGTVNAGAETLYWSGFMPSNFQDYRHAMDALVAVVIVAVCQLDEKLNALDESPQDEENG